MFIIVILMAFLIASYTDIKSREIPVWVFPALLALYILNCLRVHAVPGWNNAAGAVLMLAPCVILCAAGKLGGGDLIMFAVVGFILGINGILLYTFCLGIASVLAVLVVTVRDGKSGLRQPIPMAPVAAAAFIIYISWR